MHFAVISPISILLNKNGIKWIFNNNKKSLIFLRIWNFLLYNVCWLPDITVLRILCPIKSNYYLKYSLKCREGVNVEGYYAWSIMDNFEWHEGYTERFGVNYIDYKDGLKRLPKISAGYYTQFLHTWVVKLFVPLFPSHMSCEVVRAFIFVVSNLLSFAFLCRAELCFDDS